MLVISRVTSSPKIYSSTISSLDNKKETVMALSAAAATTSAAITLLPGDTMTPIADKMADLTSYFLIILCVIYLEKYLLPILGYLVFGILIPIVFILKGIDYYKDVKKILESAKKLVLIGLVILLSIPISEKVSGIIHETYESSIENTINEATQEITIEEDGNGGFKAIFLKIKDGATNTAERFKKVLSNFVEAIAVMIVTDCLIPVVVLVFCLWVIKNITGVLVDTTKFLPHHNSKDYKIEYDDKF